MDDNTGRFIATLELLNQARYDLGKSHQANIQLDGDNDSLKRKVGNLEREVALLKENLCSATAHADGKTAFIRQRVIDLLNAKARKIPAIKAVRDILGLSLKEAKELVEQYLGEPCVPSTEADKRDTNDFGYDFDHYF